MVSSDVPSAQVTFLKGSLRSHLCLKPVFQNGVMDMAMWQGEQKGAIGQEIQVSALGICRGCPQEVSCS